MPSTHESRLILLLKRFPQLKPSHPYEDRTLEFDAEDDRWVWVPEFEEKEDALHVDALILKKMLELMPEDMAIRCGPSIFEKALRYWESLP